MQSDAVNGFESTVVCLLTTDKNIIGPTRIRVAATNQGKRPFERLFSLVEKQSFDQDLVARSKNGVLEAEPLAEVDKALKFALGLA